MYTCKSLLVGSVANITFSLYFKEKRMDICHRMQKIQNLHSVMYLKIICFALCKTEGPPGYRAANLHIVSKLHLFLSPPHVHFVRCSDKEILNFFNPPPVQSK